nr:MAG: hypothetical protein [Bacteriophage sp.]
MKLNLIKVIIAKVIMGIVMILKCLIVILEIKEMIKEE